VGDDVREKLRPDPLAEGDSPGEKRAVLDLAKLVGNLPKERLGIAGEGRKRKQICGRGRRPMKEP